MKGRHAYLAATVSLGTIGAVSIWFTKADPLIMVYFAFFFLLLLLSALHEIRRSMLAHDHLVRRKFRGRLSDVE